MEHDFGNESLYNVLSFHDKTRICRVVRILEAVGVNSHDMQTLNMQRGKPIQLSTTIGYNSIDDPIEYSVARYRGDRNRFEVDILIDTRVEK